MPLHSGLSLLVLSISLTGLSCMAVKKGSRTAAWSVAGRLPGTGGAPSLGYAGPVTGIAGHRLVVAGGANFPGGMPWAGGKKAYYHTGWLYHLHGGTLQPQPVPFALPQAVAYSACCTVGDAVFFAGGENDNGITDKAYLLKIQNEGPVCVPLPPLPMPLTNAGAATDGRVVYVAGGESTAGTVATVYMLDLQQPGHGWSSLPALPVAVSHAVTVFLHGSNGGGLYVIGGRKKNTNGISTLYNTTWVWNAHTSHWQQRQPLPYTLSAGTGAALGNGKIFLFGGDRGAAFHRAEEVISAIAQEKDMAARALLVKKKIEIQSGHPGFSRQLLVYNAAKDEWAAGGDIPYPVPATTTAVPAGSTVFIPSGEIKAGVRTPDILKFSY